MKSKRPFATKLPSPLLSEIKELYADQSHEVFVFSVDGHKPINAETLRRNFQKYGNITTHGFRNTFKTWCMNQEPPVADFPADRYLDHGLFGLDKNYRRDNLLIKRAELAERYCAFVLGDGDDEQDDEDVFAKQVNNRGLPNFDKDPNVDTVYQLHTKRCADLDKYSEKTLLEFEFTLEHGLNDVIQPCGYTQGVIDSFYVNYKERGDIGELIRLLRECPVYSLPDISEEIIRLLKKTRLKPVPKRVYDTEQLHENILFEFERINPERGQIDNAYAEIAVNYNISIENVKSVVRRARKNGWVGDFNPFGQESLNINKGSSSDNE